MGCCRSVCERTSMIHNSRNDNAFELSFLIDGLFVNDLDTEDNGAVRQTWHSERWKCRDVK